MRHLYMVDGVGVPRKTAVRAVMDSWAKSYAEATSMLDARRTVQCRAGLVVKHTILEEEY